MTKKVFVPVITRLVRLETKMLVFFARYASITMIAIARVVIRYIHVLMSSELFVFSSLTICGMPEIKKSIAGR